MRKVKVCRYQYTDTNLAQPATAKRMATEDYVKRVDGWIVDGSEIEVDASNVDAESKTEIGFTE
jgi:hypothetical protein